MAKRMTIDRIAELAGVNRSTVSRTLNPATAHRISPGQREKILAICDRFQYRPRTSARAFASGRTSRIALILGSMRRDLLSPVFAEFIEGLTFGSQERGYVLSLHGINSRDRDKEKRLRDFLLSEEADAYLFGAALVSGPLLETIRSLEHPVVTLGHHLSKSHMFPAIVTDDTPAVAEFLKKVPQDLAGRALFLGVRGSDRSSETKFSCVRKGLVQQGLPEDFFLPEFFKVEWTGFHRDRANAAEYAWEKLDHLKKFRLIWCASDLTAQGICDTFRRHGIVPGKDIAVAGFDNIERIMEDPKPFLTTIDYRFYERGVFVAETLTELIRSNRKLDHDLILNSQYVERESCSWKNHFKRERERR